MPSVSLYAWKVSEDTSMDTFGDFGSLALESTQDGEFDTEYFPGGLDPFGNKETTGRWTRDEHLLFIRGLELFGKGWKKIASLVKTRTVVQVRTHAQKHFLKLSKARQAGDQAGLLSQRNGTAFGSAKKKHRHRPIAMTPLLLPFAQSRDSFSSQADPYNTIYHFLSPPMGTVLTRTSTLVTQADMSNESEATASNSRLVTVERTKLDVEDRTPPHWYAQRDSIGSLLQIAESLDWTKDASFCGLQFCRQSRSDTPTSTLTDTDSSYASYTAQSTYDADRAAVLPAIISVYGPYYAAAMTSIFSPAVYQHPHWTTQAEERWVQQSTYPAHQHFHNHAPAPASLALDYYQGGEVESGDAVDCRTQLHSSH